jgi:hypothetical protein
VLRWLCWWRPPCLYRAVIANLKDDTTIQGVLWSQQGAWLIFKDASLLKAAVPPTHIDGEVVVHRSNVSFLQVLP